ncbi:MAG: hypothetical protein M1831_002429 [Alyxoria varia]|nr:MAG: hypothetical protein M1831_002429 [Alyxoria varia]
MQMRTAVYLTATALSLPSLTFARSIDIEAHVIRNDFANLPQGAESFLAKIIKQRSDSNFCESAVGYLGNNIYYQYEAVSSGKNCDTTAQLKTITDALRKASDFWDRKTVYHACFKMSHGGTWTGFLQLAGANDGLEDGLCKDSRVGYEYRL